MNWKKERFTAQPLESSGLSVAGKSSDAVWCRPRGVSHTAPASRPEGTDPAWEQRERIASFSPGYLPFSNRPFRTGGIT